MHSSLLERNLNEDSYDEYIEKIINIFRLSNKNSSILFHMEIKDYHANIMLSIVNQNGEKEEFTDIVLKCDEIFYQSFLLPFVKIVNRDISIKVHDIVNLDGDDLVTFRMITENNDLLTIDGLSNDDAKKLLEISKGKKTIEGNHSLHVSNNEGIGNIWIFLLMIFILVIAFILIVFLLD